ncbi:MAG: hypothetical protein R6V10_14300 [bacterium]
MSSADTARLATSFKAKRTLVKTSLLALAAAFEMVSRNSPDMKAELAEWDSGRVFTVGVLPDGPSITMRKESDGLHYLGTGQHDADLKMLFKNVDSALMALIGMIGAHTAFAEHRAIIHGSLYEAMQINRAMVIVQKFLLPGPVLKRITKRPPVMSAHDYVIKARVMTGLAAVMLKNARK